MGSIFQPTANQKPAPGRDHSGRAAADRLTGPLLFSAAGLLTHGFALTMPSEPSLAALRLHLILCAGPIAALVALRFAAKARRHTH